MGLTVNYNQKGRSRSSTPASQRRDTKRVRGDKSPLSSSPTPSHRSYAEDVSSYLSHSDIEYQEDRTKEGHLKKVVSDLDGVIIFNGKKVSDVDFLWEDQAQKKFISVENLSPKQRQKFEQQAIGSSFYLINHNVLNLLRKETEQEDTHLSILTNGSEAHLYQVLRDPEANFATSSIFTQRNQEGVLIEGGVILDPSSKNVPMPTDRPDGLRVEIAGGISSQSTQLYHLLERLKVQEHDENKGKIYNLLSSYKTSWVVNQVKEYIQAKQLEHLDQHSSEHTMDAILIRMVDRQRGASVESMLSKLDEESLKVVWKNVNSESKKNFVKTFSDGLRWKKDTSAEILATLEELTQHAPEEMKIADPDTISFTFNQEYKPHHNKLLKMLEAALEQDFQSVPDIAEIKHIEDSASNAPLLINTVEGLYRDYRKEKGSVNISFITIQPIHPHNFTDEPHRQSQSFDDIKIPEDSFVINEGSEAARTPSVAAPRTPSPTLSE